MFSTMLISFQLHSSGFVFVDDDDFFCRYLLLFTLNSVRWELDTIFYLFFLCLAPLLIVSYVQKTGPMTFPVNDFQRWIQLAPQVCHDWIFWMESRIPIKSILAIFYKFQLYQVFDTNFSFLKHTTQNWKNK